MVGPSFRAGHIDSLPRPPQLLDARWRFTTGKASADELTRAEDARAWTYVGNAASPVPTRQPVVVRGAGAALRLVVETAQEIWGMS